MEKAQDETSAAGGVSALSAGLEGWRWEEAKGPWASGLVLFVGKWPVGSAGYVSRTKGESKNYAAKSRLPGLKEVLEHFETMELAKDRVEKATRYWLRNLLSNARHKPRGEATSA